MQNVYIFAKLARYHALRIVEFAIRSTTCGCSSLCKIASSLSQSETNQRHECSKYLSSHRRICLELVRHDHMNLCAPEQNETRQNDRADGNLATCGASILGRYLLSFLSWNSKNNSHSWILCERPASPDRADMRKTPTAWQAGSMAASSADMP